MKKLIQITLDYGKMVKFSHTLFALPFAGLSFVSALAETNKTPSELQRILFLIVLCMFSARNAAMGFNRWADRKIDALNPRTKDREIPKGVISEKSVLFFVVGFCVLFILSSYFINFLCFLLSFPTLGIILFYSYTKRFTYLCHYVLGLGIGIAPMGAYLSVTEYFSLPPILWSFGLMLHIAGFDILYSTQDIEIDKTIEMKSIPVKFGILYALLISKLTHAICFILFLFAGFTAGLGVWYYTFLGITGILLIVEHLLVSPRNMKRLPIAFFHINASISIILFIGIFLDKWSIVLSKLGIMI
ncbi:MAG: putative 4-hydroxybenzoate polyprenyltransferase [Leptospiraceae bacterium]|nr:UbiA family prenyltransferase [Leptospiraceae bacterium]MCK6381430.1 putative 4-hydroxybenzoate polyprenyltransferase [Leptospiraceae bacterium]NUM42397.1 UbiA family prenyltransferase [Leptospiraceae bacterium]